MAVVEQDELVSILVEAIPPPDRLRLLADWIDAKYPGDADPEIQRDLRRWARLAHYALNTYEATLNDGQEAPDAS